MTGTFRVKAFNGHSLLGGAAPLPRNRLAGLDRGGEGRLRKRMTIESYDEYHSDHSGRSMFVGEFGLPFGMAPGSSKTAVSLPGENPGW